jgi:two-component system, NtrC family, sensor histidine kinase HydH
MIAHARAACVTSMNDQYAVLAELAGGFIHEIKNHLSTLGLNLQLLAEDFQTPETHRERRALTRIQKLTSECEHLVQVANDFLRFARIKLDKKPTDLIRVIEEMVDFFAPTARAASIEIKTFLSADLPPVLLDSDLFKQALLNLMLNAEQAMPQGGELTIQAALEPDCEGSEAKREAQPEISAPRSALRAPRVCLSLIDTGKGIAPDVLGKIWRPFFSTRPGGSGLGLPTTRKIIEAHGGTIEVQSEVGRGTKFTIRLPVCEREPPSNQFDV